MQTLPDLADGTLEEAIEKLAELAVDRRHFGQPLVKLAFGSEWLSSIGTKLNENPHLRNALIGGGVGALATGGATAFRNAGKDPSERKSILGSALTGGLAGAATGGGLSAAYDAYKQIGTPAPSDPNISPMTFEHHGKKYTLTPEMLRNNPDLAAQVTSTQQQTPSQKAVDVGLGGLGAVYSAAPYTLPAVGSMMGLDALMESQGLAMGDRNYAKLPGKALQGLGGIGKRIFGDNHVSDWLHEGGTKLKDWGGNRNWPGSINARNSTNPDHLSTGFNSDRARTMGDVPPDLSPAQGAEGRRQATDTITGERSWIDRLTNKKNPAGAKVPVQLHEEVPQPDAPGPTKEVWKREPVNQNDIDPATNRPRMTGSNDVLISTENQLIKQPPKKVPLDFDVEYTPEHIRQLREHGVNTAAQNAGVKFPESPHVRKNPFGHPQLVTKSIFHPSRLAPRAALYAGLPLGEAAIRHYIGRGEGDDKLTKLVEQLHASGQLPGADVPTQAAGQEVPEYLRNFLKRD